MCRSIKAVNKLVKCLKWQLLVKTGAHQYDSSVFSSSPFHIGGSNVSPLERRTVLKYFVKWKMWSVEAGKKIRRHKTEVKKSHRDEWRRRNAREMHFYALSNVGFLELDSKKMPQRVPTFFVLVWEKEFFSVISTFLFFRFGINELF